ncbi:MAG: hypothetical protein HQ541_19760 [Mariniphaga sp.]|nr:hypothetical protein [Mariniphaga sp.]
MKSPISDFSFQGSSKRSFSDFISFLKSEDLKSKKIIKRFYVIYVIAAIFYILLFIVNPDPELTFQARISGSCFIVAFLIYIHLFRNKYIKLKKIDYLAASRHFLADAKKRFSFWNKELFWMIPTFILIDYGATFSLTKYINITNIITEILLIQLGYFCLIVISFYFGRLDWKKKKMPIFNKITNILAEFEE